MYLDQAIDEACDCEFPVQCDELLDRCGDMEVQTPNGGSQTLRQIMDVCNESPNEFSTQREFRHHIYNFVSEEYIGRENYDDRGHTFDSEPEISF